MTAATENETVLAVERKKTSCFEEEQVRSETFLEPAGVRLLIVEDQVADSVLTEELVRESMPEYLWDIDKALTIEEAILQLSTTSFDLALVDLGMGEVEGAQTVDLLCLVAPQVPVVVYSGTENSTILEESLRRGAFICLPKDKTSPEIMRMALTNALSREALKE